jgi:hypothetical protein
MQLLAQVAGVKPHGGLSKLKSNFYILYIIPPRASAARGGLHFARNIVKRIHLPSSLEELQVLCTKGL